MADDDNDRPVTMTFKELKKRKLHLSENLKKVYDEGLQTLKAQHRRKNDPRFDPRVHGVCNVEDWRFLEVEQKRLFQKLKATYSKKQCLEDRKKTLKALGLVTQRIATSKDINFRREYMNKLKEEQTEKLESGERVKFMKRSELRKCIQNKRLETMNKKEAGRYLNRKRKMNIAVDD